MAKNPNLPKHIVKKNRFYYQDTKTGKYIHVNQVANYKAPLDKETKDRQIRSQRWDLEKD